MEVLYSQYIELIITIVLDSVNWLLIKSMECIFIIFIITIIIILIYSDVILLIKVLSINIIIFISIFINNNIIIIGYICSKVNINSKEIIAYSTINNIRIIHISIIINEGNHIINHSIGKSLLFISIDILLHYNYK